MEGSNIQPGLELAGRYRLVSLLGQGGMGSVWKAEHLALGSDVAVKLIDPAIAQNEQARERFVREARAAAKLRSPHVVQILDYGVDGDVPFIVMEMLRGESLADRIDRLGRLAPEDTARIMSEVARALTRAHEAGIIHRDLKPDNVFLNENDDTEVAKVLDFGVARIEQFSSENAGMTSTGAVLGTPYYMSPEQAEGSKMMDHRTDIWAMAVMTYECILGLRPFVGETLGALFVSICSREIPTPSSVGDVPPGFDAWFQKGTARVVADRFRTAREAAQALRAVCQVAGDGERESALPSDVAEAERTMMASDRPPSGSDSMGGAAAAQSAMAAQASSTAGLAHTAIEIPGAKKSSPVPLILGGVAVLVAAVALFSLRGGGSETEEIEPVVASNGATDESAAVEAPSVKDEEKPEEEVAEKDAVPEKPEEKIDPEPAPAPAPKPVVAPLPKPVAVKPAPAPAPKPVTAPAPKPVVQAAPAPAPAPKPKRVNLGI